MFWLHCGDIFKMPPKGKGKGKPAGGTGGPGEEAKAGEKISEVEISIPF